MSAVERFAQQIPLNLQEIFIWYFEQKGVDNPERFLMQQESSATVPQTNLNQLIAEQSQTPENSTYEQLLLGMLGKLFDKVGNKKSDLMEILSSLKTKRLTRKDKNNEI